MFLGPLLWIFSFLEGWQKPSFPLTFNLWLLTWVTFVPAIRGGAKHDLTVKTSFQAALRFNEI